MPSKEGSIVAEDDRSTDDESLKEEFIENGKSRTAPWLSSNKPKSNGTNSLFKDDLDGRSFGGTDDEDVDGIPLDGAALLKSAKQEGK